MAGSFVLFTDGAARGNPGPAAIGAVLYRREGSDLVKVAELSRAIGRATNNVAEYRAVVEGLSMTAAHAPDRLELKADSQLLIRQLAGQYRVRAPGLRDLYEQARSALQAIPEVRLDHVPRERNREADALANAALDQ